MDSSIVTPPSRHCRRLGWACRQGKDSCRSRPWPGLAVTVLLVLPALSCGADLPKGTAVPDPDLMALLRPNDPISEERLIRTPEGHGYYLAHLRGLHRSGYVETYLDQLDERGVAVEASADSSLHAEVEARHVLGYHFHAVQETALKPYTIRYRLGWDGRERDAERRDHPHPIRLSGRWLVFRLPEGFFEPWTTAVLVPEKSVVEPPFPFPLPPDAILLAVEEVYGTWPTGHGLVRDKLPSQLFFSFLSRTPPVEVMRFYGQVLAPVSAQLVVTGDKAGEQPAVAAKVAGRPVWAPREIRWIRVDEDGSLFSLAASGFGVRTGPNATFVPRRENPYGQIESLRGVPKDVRRYKAGLTFLAVKPE